jgi:hypothetical protein
VRTKNLKEAEAVRGDGQDSDSDESEFQSAKSSDGEDDALMPVPIQPDRGL